MRLVGIAVVELLRLRDADGEANDSKHVDESVCHLRNILSGSLEKRRRDSVKFNLLRELLGLKISLLLKFNTPNARLYRNLARKKQNQK